MGLLTPPAQKTCYVRSTLALQAAGTHTWHSSDRWSCWLQDCRIVIRQSAILGDEFDMRNELE